MSYLVLGTCSLCGGEVRVPALYMSVVPPTPTCARCGATKAAHGPVIEMQRPTRTLTTANVRVSDKTGEG